jgi:hypothetical protein
VNESDNIGAVTVCLVWCLFVLCLIFAAGRGLAAVCGR